MQPNPSELFTINSNAKLSDKESRRHLLNAISKYEAIRPNAIAQYEHLELAKERAAAIKWKAIENLDSYLIEFEANFIKRGGKVLWAQDANDANKEIIAILKRLNSKSVLGSKSNTTEEIGLNHTLQKHQIKNISTDIGEFIQELFQEETYHPALPAIHKTIEDIAVVFNQKFGLPLDSTSDQIVNHIRATLHATFQSCEVGITGANYLIADQGAVVISENQGNGLLSMSMPKVHIVIVGIEKILPNMADLDLFWPLQSSYSIGAKSNVYNTILSGPCYADENDGPTEMFVILLDNGRSNLIANQTQRQALSCIRCGACLNVCPIYQNIGGHAYGGGIGGPIGSILSPYIKGLKDYKHLSYASTLCGKCSDVCPVKIDLHNLLLLSRKDVVTEELSGKTEKGIYFFWKKGMLNRETMNKGGAVIKNFILSNFFKKRWGKQREFPKLAPKSFNEEWREKHPIL
jgi:L-lactate dehydrogenase complex protein LldF